MRVSVHNMSHSVCSQKGAVAIIVALSIFVLIGMLGLVLDLGHLYVAKSELQNAADAAALSGAKQLNGTAAGVCCGADSARERAKEAAQLNNYDLNSVAVVLDDANIMVSNCPDDDCTWWPVNSITTDAEASDKTFIKVDTGLRTLQTWFARIWNMFQTSTFGMAVAGRYVVDVAPIGVCAVNKNVTEYGFIRGVSYNLPDLNPLGATAVPMWINPVDTPPAACDPNHASTSFAVPFVCTGRSAINPAADTVYVSTGTSAALNKALNVRFASRPSDYNGSGCDYDSAPPDQNIKEYTCTNAAGSDDCLRNNTPITGLPRQWMATDPVRQTVWFGDTNNQIVATVQSLRNGSLSVSAWRNTLTATQWGVLWSYNKEVSSFATSPYTYYSTSDWPTLYKNTATSYPSPTPYAASGTEFFQAPSSLTGAATEIPRRVLNILIIDCPNMSGGPGMSCTELPVLGIGQFFMQVQANIPKYMGTEFAGLLPKPLPPADIRLYR